MEKKKIRVLVAKPGLDGHDRGALVISQALKDEGMEVVYTGLRQTPAQIVASAIQEDVDCIGLSCLSGAHNELFPEVVRLLKEEGAEDILVVGGGVIPDEDIPSLKEKGIAEVFTPGSPTKEIAHFIESNVGNRDDIFGKASQVSPRKIDHIGIAVRSIEETLPFYTKVLGLRLTGMDQVETEQVRVAFLEIGETRLELLEPTASESAIAQFIEKKGEGIHHIAFQVEDAAASLSLASSQGIRLIHEQPKPGAHGSLIGFLHPKSTHGVLVEFCQPHGTQGNGGKVVE